MHLPRTMPLRSLFPTLLTLLLFTLTPPFVTSSQCSDPSSIHCEVCPTSSRGNDIAGLPRINARGSLISNDLASYSWYACDAFGHHCSSFLSNPQYSHWLNPMPNPAHPINYVQSIVAYSLFALACVLVSLTTGCSLLCCRYWYDRDLGGLCGGVHPQRKLRHIGVVLDPHRKVWTYRPCERWLARAFILTFVVLLWTWVGLGYFEGTTRLPAAVKDTIVSPGGLVETVQWTEGSLVQLLAGWTSQTLYATIANISTAFTSASLPALLTQLQCVSGPLHALPNLTATSTFLSSLTSLTALLSSTQHSVDVALNASLASLTSPLASIQTNLTTFNSSATAAATVTNLTAANLTTLTPLTLTLQADATILSASLTTFNLTAPNTSTLLTVAASPIASLLALIPNNVTTLPMPVAADRALLLARFANLTSALAGLPNLTAVAANATRYNADVSSTLTSLTATVASLTRTIAAVNAWTASGQALNASVTGYVGVVGGWSLAPEVALVQAVNASLDAWVLAGVGVVAGQVAGVSNLTSTLPCMQTLLPLLNVTTTQLISLSSSLPSILANYTAELNVTLPSVITTLANVSATLTSLTSANSTSLLNLSSVLSTLTNASTAVRDITSTLNLTQLTSLMSTQAAILSTVNLSSTLTTLLALNATLTASIVPTSFASSLTSYQLRYQSLSANLTAFNADLVRWNADGKGVKRCQLNPNVNCTYTRQCTAVGDYCLIDHDRVQLLASQLSVYNTSYPAATQLTSVVNAVQAASAAVTTAQLPADKAALIAMTSGLRALPTPVATAQATVQPVLAQLKAFTVPAVDSLFTALAANVSSALNFSSAVSTLNALNATLGDVTGELPTFDSVVLLLTTLDTFLFDHFPSTYGPALLSFSTLPTSSTPSSSSPTSTIANLTLTLATLVNAMVADLSSSPLIADSLGSYDFVGRSATVRSYLDLLYTSEQLQFGSVHWLATIFNLFTSSINILNPYTFPLPLPSPSSSFLNSTNTTTSTAVVDAYNATQWSAFASFNQQPNRVNVDAHGQSYPSSAVCLTQACLDNTVDYYTNTGLQTLTSGVVPIPVTVPHLNGLLFLMPAFIGGLALLALGLWRSYKWASWVASVVAALILVFLPLIFMFAMLLFPLVIVQGDVCYGGVNLGYSMLQQQQDTVCTQIGGTGTADNCVMYVDDFSIILNLPELYRDILGGQCSDDDVDDAVLAMFNSLRASADTWPGEKLDAAVTAFNNDTGGVQLQAGLSTLLQQAAADTSAHLDAFITSLAAGISCESLHSNWQAMHSSFCCSVTTSLYWFCGCWFLIGLTMLGCGVPAAVCGRKRLADVIPDSELRIIDRYFSKDRVLKEEGWLRKSRAVQGDAVAGKAGLPGGAARLGRNSRSVAPLEGEVEAIEMAYARADKDKADADAAGKPADAAGAKAVGEGGEARYGRVVSVAARSARPSAIDVALPSPVSAAHRHSPSHSHSAADVDDRRGLNVALGGERGRGRALSAEHPLALTRGSPSPRLSGMRGVGVGGEGEGGESGEVPPTPLAILVHRPSLVSPVSPQRGVFSYAEDVEEEEGGVGEDVASYQNKWPSLSSASSSAGVEERKEGGGVGGQGGVRGYGTTPVRIAGVGGVGVLGGTGEVRRRGVEGEAEEEKTGESSLDETSSEEEESTDEEEEEKEADDAKGVTTSTIPMPRFQ